MESTYFGITALGLGAGALLHHKFVILSWMSFLIMLVFIVKLDTVCVDKMMSSVS